MGFFIGFSNRGVCTMKKKNNHNGNGNGNNKVTVVTFLSREQVDYLDGLGKDSFFHYGRKLCRTKILSELVEVARKLDVELSEIDLGKETLSEGLLRLIDTNHTHEE